MPTFDNGWICRECWCANREFDSRCYRCHADRPEWVGTLTVDEVGKRSEPEAPAMVTAMPAPPEEPATSPAVMTEGSATRQPGRFCLRCGHHLAPGAGFCTQCGTAAVETDADIAAEAPVAPPAGASPVSFTMPSLRIPGLDGRSFIAGARRDVIAYREQHRVGWEVTMSVLAVAFVTIGFVADRLLDGPGGLVGVVLTLMTAVSVAEYLLRLGVASDRVAFARSHVIELAAIVPPLRGLRVLPLLWLVWLQPMTQRLRQPRVPRPHRPHAPAMRHRPHAPAMRHRPWLPIAWAVLLITSAVATYGYASSGGLAGREPQFAVLIMILVTFSGLTASLATWYADARRIRAEEIPQRLQVLSGLSESGAITPAEFASRREALLSALSPMPNGQMADGAGIAPTTRSA